MKTKELLCVALISENGKRYDAEIYSDGTFKREDGEFCRLTPHEFETIQVLARRSSREKMLTVVANDVVPYREGDKEPEAYIENLLPYTEADFLLPEEKTKSSVPAAADESEGDPEMIDEMLQQQMEEPDEADIKERPASNPDATADTDTREVETPNEENSTASAEEPAPESKAKSKKKAKKEKRAGSKAPVILAIILVLLLLCGAGFGLGYINGYINVGPLQSTSEVSSAPESTSSEETVEPTPTPVPPKTEINLTINAMEGAEVSGSTDVGVNENAQPESEPATSSSAEQAP